MASDDDISTDEEYRPTKKRSRPQPIEDVIRYGALHLPNLVAAAHGAEEKGAKGRNL